MKKRYISAQEAADTLGVSINTLYSYVSRGLIRSETLDGSHRARRYHAEDVMKVKQRKDERKNPATVAESALDWGTPVLESALTLITVERLYYRGHDAIVLSETHTFEQVAALFWTGRFEDAASLFSRPPDASPYLAALNRLQQTPALVSRLSIVLALAGDNDFAAYDLNADSVARTGARLLHLLASGLVNHQSFQEGVGETLRRVWCPNVPDAGRLLNAALVLCADHELNASSFAARVVASAEMHPYGVVAAGLAALQGAKHGGVTERVAALLREVRTPDDARSVVAEWLRRGERIPGFGHKLYPGGDPRAAHLLRLLHDSAHDHLAVRNGSALQLTMRERLDLAANIDFPLAILADVLNLPRGGGLALFALGRTVGWIGHAIEQYESGQLIRPRARYTGVPPRE